MMQVLNCQSDSIFVVSNEVMNNTSMSADQTVDYAEALAPNCLFSNLESHKILGCDLNDADADRETRRKTELKFELEQFVPLNEKPSTLFDKHS